MVKLITQIVILRVHENLHATIKYLYMLNALILSTVWTEDHSQQYCFCAPHCCLCGALVNITEGASSECRLGQTSLAPINQCRRGTTIAVWAVGGEVYSNYSTINHYYKANTRSCHIRMAESRLNYDENAL